MDRRSLNGRKKDYILTNRWDKWKHWNIETYEDQKTPVVMIGENLRDKHYEQISEWYGNYLFGKY